MWVRGLQSQGEGAFQQHHYYNEYSFVCLGANRVPWWWDGPMARSVRYRGNTVVGYGGFGIGDKSTDILLEANSMINATKPMLINRTSTSNVMVRD